MAEGRAAGGGQEQQGGGTQQGEAVFGEEGALQMGTGMGWELVLFSPACPLHPSVAGQLRNTGLEGQNGEKGRKKRHQKG